MESACKLALTQIRSPRYHHLNAILQQIRIFLLKKSRINLRQIILKDTLEAQLITKEMKMINDETKKKLRELKLSELINAYEIYSKNTDWMELSFEQKFQMMTDYLYQEKYNNSVKILLSKAKFRIPKADTTSLVYEGRGIDRNLITELSSCQFISSNTNIVFQGFTGSGKTYLACALGRQACKQ